MTDNPSFPSWHISQAEIDTIDGRIRAFEFAFVFWMGGTFALFLFCLIAVIWKVVS